MGHNQAHPGGNLSNRSDRGGGSQHRGSIGNASGAYGHNQGASANATGSAGRDQSSSQDDYGPRGASTGSGRQEFKQDLRPRLNYGKHIFTINCVRKIANYSIERYKYLKIPILFLLQLPIPLNQPKDPVVNPICIAKHPKVEEKRIECPTQKQGIPYLI